MRYRSWLCLAMAALQPACGAGWHRVTTPAPATYPPRQQVQLWSLGRMHRWHAVRASADSVSGIPFLRPIDCDSCRVSIPQAEVDSLRLGNPTGALWKSVGFTLGATAVAAILVCRFSRECSFGE